MRKMKKFIRMSRRNFPASNERYRHWKENRPVTTEEETQTKILMWLSVQSSGLVTLYVYFLFNKAASNTKTIGAWTDSYFSQQNVRNKRFYFQESKICGELSNVDEIQPKGQSV